MPATYEPIATTTLGSAATSITFSSIPSTYTDLRIVFTGTGGNLCALQFNSDTGTNYSCTAITGDGTSATSERETSSTSMKIISPSWGMGIGQPVLVAADIFSYAGSTNKTVLSTWSADGNGFGYTSRNVGLWRNTAAITSILLTSLQSNQFYAGSTATLYGIKNA